MPFKSQIIGMLLNAMGHDFNNELTKSLPKEWSDKIRFAVRDDSTSRKMVYTDFCIARRYDTSSNDVILKDYIVGGNYTCFIEGSKEDIFKATMALLHPQRQLFVGRRNCQFNNSAIWDDKENKPTVLDNVCIEDIIFNVKYDRSSSKTPIFNRKHIIECKGYADYKKKELDDEIKDKLNTALGDRRWHPVFTILKRSVPIQFKYPLYGDMLGYFIMSTASMNKYEDMREI